MQHSIALTIAQGITVFRLRSGILQGNVQHCLAMANGFFICPAFARMIFGAWPNMSCTFVGGTKVVRETFSILSGAVFIGL